MTDRIDTTADAVEASALPRVHEVHSDPCVTGPCEDSLPSAMKSSSEAKSPARWAYERLILYIENFEKQLDNAHEVAMGFTGGEAGVIRIEGMGYFDPDIVTFYGSDEDGLRTQIIQHVAQLNVMLQALPKPESLDAPRRIGFQLAKDLDTGAESDDKSADASA
jgi:hypothetical protein